MRGASRQVRTRPPEIRMVQSCVRGSVQLHAYFPARFISNVAWGLHELRPQPAVISRPMWSEVPTFEGQCQGRGLLEGLPALSPHVHLDI